MIMIIRSSEKIVNPMRYAGYIYDYAHSLFGENYTGNLDRHNAHMAALWRQLRQKFPDKLCSLMSFGRFSKDSRRGEGSFIAATNVQQLSQQMP